MKISKIKEINKIKKLTDQYETLEARLTVIADKYQEKMRIIENQINKLKLK